MGIFQIRGITDQGSSLPANASAARSLLCFDVNCEAGLEFHGEVVVVNGDLLDQLSDEAFVEFGDFGLLTTDEVLQLLDPVHGFFPMITIDFVLFFLVAEPENLISDGIVWI